MKNIKLLIAYDGTNYLGWQKTSEGPSIEESLERVLEKIFQHKILLQAASRTDAGVHANGQVVNFFSDKELNLERLKISLNQLLPSDIAVLECKEEKQSFHPTLDVIQKEYRYFICTGAVQMPSQRFYSWHCPKLNQFSDMCEAAALFIGTKDFSAVCNFRKQQHYETYVREVFGVEIEEFSQKRLMIKIRGKNFLYKMVRNIVGTLAYVGMGKLQLAQISAILSSHNRIQAGITAPAHGLFLHQVEYSHYYQGLFEL
jgi:tRNA pseudouridine38-40 synthase